MTIKPRPHKKRRPASAHTPAGDDQVEFLLHELQVHSEEITVQNEQLLKAQSEIELARDRFAELYDFAPVGYLLLDVHGAIHECNIAASSLLGRPRQFLLTVPLPALVENRALLGHFLTKAAGLHEGQTVQVEVTSKAPPHHNLRLLAKPRTTENGARMLFTAIMNVTNERRLEIERRGALEREVVRARELADQVADRTRAELRVKALLERLVSVQEDERRRLARDIHDQFGQQLTALRLTLSMAKQLAKDRAMRKELARAEAIAERIDRDIDHLTWQLRPAALDELGLGPALESFVRGWQPVAGVDVQFDATRLSGRLPLDIENHLYRIVQEALNNIVKHARATKVTVTIETLRRSVRVAIQDNGVGFDTVRNKAADGMGVVGMRERAALIGGTVEVISAKGQGTTVSVQVPLPSD